MGAGDTTLPNYVLEQAHWAPGSTVTWYYSGTSSAVFAQQLASGYAAPDLFPAEIRAAFSRWDDFGGIRFQEVSSAAAANVVIGWSNIDGPYNVLAQASYSYWTTTHLFAPPVYITFDSSESYNPSSGSERLSSGTGTFYAIALHEIGHAIGIDHYSGGQAIMNPYISSLNDLTASDIAAVQALYGANVSHEIVWDFNWRMTAVGDFNGDGATDLMWNNGAGVLGGWIMANNARAGTLDLPYFAGWTTIGTGDFNGDGVTDVLWQNGSGLVGEWFMGSGTRQGTATIQYMPGWTVIATGDFTGDGTTDIVWDNGAGNLGSWVMQGGQIAGTLALPYFPDWDLVATGDFNSDGIDDFIWQNASGDVGEWIMGGGTRAGTLILGSMAGWIPLGSGDFNNDGCDDVLWRDINGVTQAWIMNQGNVQQRIGEGSSANLAFVTIGDFDRDGYDDIMWQNRTSGSISIWNMGAGGVVTSMITDPIAGNEIAAGLATGALLHQLDSFHFLPADTEPAAAAPNWAGYEGLA
jgi:predicted Zn-dependent protease